MGIQIICPNCKRTISDNSILDSADVGEGHNSDFITCECGEKINYLEMKNQLMGQKTIGKRFLSWLRPSKKIRA